MGSATLAFRSSKRCNATVFGFAGLARVAAGGSALGPDIVSALLAARRPGLADLSARETEVLALAAQGHSNMAIAARLVVTERTIEAHMRSIFQRLQLPESPDSHRRVLAALAYLRAQ
ncbi:helix-turn-helix transcriptional regulator [Catelliglobosispora koreensis]|uniref:helix-turn-helix transcriptional regulator n=1 Tax=Catelliglobosispora koreensis TaxID=129052 RepID=UPI00068876C2|nr:LuxR C-terminal-related transcriptional regulator [Catelliglobosispora koreensis]